MEFRRVLFRSRTCSPPRQAALALIVPPAALAHDPDPRRRACAQTAKPDDLAVVAHRTRPRRANFLRKPVADMTQEIAKIIVRAIRELQQLRLRRRPPVGVPWEVDLALLRSEEHTSELQSLMRISYAVFCLKQ